MATTMSNGGPNVEANPPLPASSNGKQQPAKSTGSNSKPVDAVRKQPGNPSDGGQRRSVPPKAWTGVNPITQRSINTSQQNGAGPQPKNSARREIISAGSSEKLERDRLTHLIGSYTGHAVILTLYNGEIFSGIFFGASIESTEPEYLLRMTQRIKTARRGELNGLQGNVETFVGTGEDHAKSFNIKDVRVISVEGADLSFQEKLPNGSTSGFRTDAEISGNLGVRERQLQRWNPSTDTDVDLSLESSASGGEWDQFKANEQLFGLKSDYDENIYTTTIDRTNPSYREREARAQRIAHEIEGSSTNSAHVREERGIIDEDAGLDEEDKYSGVRNRTADYPPLQSSQANKYMPPARRPPSGKPTVAGAPVDPAIISSQIARTDANPPERATSTTDSVGNATTANSKKDKSPEAKREPLPDAPTNNATSVSESRPADDLRAPTPTAPGNTETADVRDAFQKFAVSQKTRVAEDRRKRVNQDKAIKLNDLKKFSTNFKLHTPVPRDLVPILAKDTAKQHEIVEKAQREAEQKLAAPTKTLTSSGDPSISAKADGTRAPPNTAVNERQDHPLGRQGFPPRGPQAGVTARDKQQQYSPAFPAAPSNAQGMLSHRLAENHSRHKLGMPVSIPAPLPIQSAQKPPSRPANVGTVPSSQNSSTVRTPTSAVSTKFNVNARDFKPNPAASSFKPTEPSPISSPIANARPSSRASSPSDFFGSKKPLPPGERPSILDHFDPLKRLKEKAEKENKVKDYAPNGGIVYAHATPVTWTQVDDDKNFKSYKTMYEDTPPASNITSPHPAPTSPINPALLHQLPPHLQNGPQGIPQIQTPQQPSYQAPPQPHHYPGVPHHYEEQRVHPSPSASTAYPAPRMPPTYMAYPQPVGQPVHFAAGQPIPPYGIAPNGPQPQAFRQYHGGPPFPHSPGQHFAAPMMVHTSSQGGYMAPQPMHSSQIPVYPAGQVPYNGHSQPPSGYPSPGRATAMAHQSSYQGQNGQMYINGAQYGAPIYAQQPPPHSTPMRSFASPQPHYNQSPQQQAHYPPQISRVPSNSYSHHPQGQFQYMQSQNPHPPGVPVEGGEGPK